MNIEHLKLFVRVAQTRNISLAGAELGLSPAVASSHIAKLEATLKVRLIHRTTRKVSLTEEGEAFLSHAEDVLASVEAAEASVGLGGDALSGTLRITAPASFGRMHLMPAISAFMTSHPKLSLDCRFSDNIMDMVEGGFDVAIRNAELTSSSLVARKLAVDHRIVCASPEYLARRGCPRWPEDLQHHDCITLRGLDHWEFQSPKGKTSFRAKGRFRADNGEAVRDACVQGLGITICSVWIAYEHLQRGELVRVLEDSELVSDTGIWALYPSSRNLAPKVGRFIDYIKERFGERPYWEL